VVSKASAAVDIWTRASVYILLVNAATFLHTCPVLEREITTIAVRNTTLHQCVQLVKVEEENHRVAMMLDVVVGVLQKQTSQKVGLDCASVAEIIVYLGHPTVGMLEISKVVDTGIPDEDGNGPAEEQSGQRRLRTRQTKPEAADEPCLSGCP